VTPGPAALQQARTFLHLHVGAGTGENPGVKLSTRAKILVGLGLVLGSVVWLVLLDYGVNAGRIHYGVHVNGIDVGGMTVDEAQDVLRAEAKKRRLAGVALSAEGMDCSFDPRKVGWTPRAKATAQRARDVGSEGGVAGALSDRLNAWFAGVEVEWAAELRDSDRVTRLIDDCQRQAEALGLTLDRERLRELMLRAVETWPRQIYQVPVSASD